MVMGWLQLLNPAGRKPTMVPEEQGSLSEKKAM